MSKAIEGAALLAGAAVLSALVLPAGSALIPFLVGIEGSLLAGGVAMEAGAIASALTNNRGMNITTRQAAAARQVIYGQQRVGGIMVYNSTTGSSLNQWNAVIVLAGHEIDSIVNLYLDGRQVHWEVGSNANITRNGVNFGGNADGGTYTGPDGIQYNFGGGPGGTHVFCSPHFGDQAEGTVDSNLTANDPIWATTAAGSPWLGGCAYIYLKIEYSTSLFAAMPEVRITVNGKSQIFDPRTGTTGFTSNWALCMADVITDPVFGLGDDSVNQDQLIAAANVCDELVVCKAGNEARYTTNYHYDTTTSPGDALAAMASGAAGRLSRIGGEWYIWPAYYQGPSFQFDSNALTGSVQWKPYRSTRDLINCVNGTYIAPTFPFNIEGNLYDQNGFYNGQIQNNFNFGWQQTSFPQYSEDTLHGFASNQYLTEDGGVLFPRDINLPTVISVSQAQRVAKIMLMRNRQQGSGSFPMNLDAWQMQPCDTMEFTWPEMGWTEKLLEIAGVNFTIDTVDDDTAPSVRCTMQVQETAPSVYEWNPATEELTVYDVPAFPSQYSTVPAPPTNLSLTSGAATALITLDGVVHPRIEVQWDTPMDALTTQIQVQYAATSNPTLWIDAGLVDVANNLTFIPDVVAGQDYNVRIRSLRATGVASTWEEIDGYSVRVTLAVQGMLALAPGTLVSYAPGDGTATIEVSGFTAVVGNASVAVLPTGPVDISGLSMSTLYWVYYIDPNFTGGSITPIATTNSADFLNKGIGYFLIDSIVTAYASSTSSTTTNTFNNLETDSFIEAGATGDSSGSTATGTFLQTPAAAVGDDSVWSAAGNAPYADGYWYYNLGVQDSATEFTYGFNFKFPGASDIANCQAVEFELQLYVVINGTPYIFNMAWQLDLGGSQNARYFTYTGNTTTNPGSWNDAPTPISVTRSMFTPGSYATISATFQRGTDSSGNPTMTHVSLTLNGTTYPVNVTQAAAVATSANGNLSSTNYLHAAFQLDTNGSSTPPSFTVNTNSMDVTAGTVTTSTATGGRYSPSSYQDIGTRTTQNPTAAYDSDASTSAIVSSTASSTVSTRGDFILGGFASTSLTYASTLNIVISASAQTSGSSATVNVTIGSTVTSYTVAAGASTITASIPSGTALNTISVEIEAAASYVGGVGTEVTPPPVGGGGGGRTVGIASISISEVFIQ